MENSPQYSTNIGNSFSVHTADRNYNISPQRIMIYDSNTNITNEKHHELLLWLFTCFCYLIFFIFLYINLIDNLSLKFVIAPLIVYNLFEICYNIKKSCFSNYGSFYIINRF